MMITLLQSILKPGVILHSFPFASFQNERHLKLQQSRVRPFPAVPVSEENRFLDA